MVFRCPNIKSEDTKLYIVNDPYCEYFVMAHKKSCFFCKHLSDLVYDYENGPYMFICDKDCYSSKCMNGNCQNFEEED